MPQARLFSGGSGAGECGFRCPESRDLCQHGVDAATGVQVGIDGGVTLAIGVHYQHAGGLVRLLDHVREMVAVVLGESWPQNHQVKRALA